MLCYCLKLLLFTLKCCKYLGMMVILDYWVIDSKAKLLTMTLCMMISYHAESIAILF